VAVAQARLDRDDLGENWALTKRFRAGIRPRPGQMAARAGAPDSSPLGSGCGSTCRRPGHNAEAAKPRAHFPRAIVQSHRAAATARELRVEMRCVRSPPVRTPPQDGLGAPGQRQPDAWIARGIELFGPARCMFASNFPVDGLCASFDAIVSGMLAIAREFSAAEQRAFFHDNAIRIYDMERT
jgi:hypothetical protein